MTERTTRSYIMNPRSDEYDIHIHKYFKGYDIAYRCGHTVSTFVEYCSVEHRDTRVKELAKLLCLPCETEQLERIEQDYGSM